MTHTVGISMPHLFLQIAIILIACWVLGRILVYFGQAQVVSDMVAGFLLGPSLLGLITPTVQNWLFPREITLENASETVYVQHPNLVILHGLGQLGLVFYMFTVGASFDPKILANHVRQSVLVSVAGIAVPLIAGAMLGWWLSQDELFFTAQTSPAIAALFMGCAIAIAAFPMLARIINESGLSRTRLGTIALASAALDDAAAWIILALIVALVTQSSLLILFTFAGIVLYLLIMLFPGRILFRRLCDWSVLGVEKTRSDVLVLVTVVLLLSSAVTEFIGIYSVFGAFVVGLSMPKGKLNQQVQSWVQPISSHIFLPIFFVYSGLHIRLELLFDSAIGKVLFATLLVGVISKGGACYCACRVVKLTHRDSVALASLMNARGLMELIVLDIGRQVGLLTPALYTVLAVMAIITTLVASPLYSWAQRPHCEQAAVHGGGT